MDGNELIALITVVVGVGTVSVALFRPITRQMASLLEAMTRERSSPAAPPDFERLRELLETIHARLDRIEERQDFTDALLGQGKAPEPLVAPPRED